MKNDTIVAELTETLLNNPAFAEKLNRLDVDQLRHQLLALAQLRLLKELTEGPGNRELINNLMSVIKPLTALHLRDKDQTERRKTARERADAREQERLSRKPVKRSKPALATTESEESPKPALSSVPERLDESNEVTLRSAGDGTYSTPGNGVDHEFAQLAANP